MATGWLQGDPISDYELGVTYVIEFWTSWCPPCKDSLLRLNALATKYKDQNLVVVVINVNETPAVVTDYINQHKLSENYRVALDEQGQLYTDWSKLTAQPAIPLTIVVNRQGKIIWIGQATQLTEPLLVQYMQTIL